MGAAPSRRSLGYGAWAHVAFLGGVSPFPLGLRFFFFASLLGAGVLGVPGLWHLWPLRVGRSAAWACSGVILWLHAEFGSAYILVSGPADSDRRAQYRSVQKRGVLPGGPWGGPPGGIPWVGMGLPQSRQNAASPEHRWFLMDRPGGRFDLHGQSASNGGFTNGGFENPRKNSQKT